MYSCLVHAKPIAVVKARGDRKEVERLLREYGITERRLAKGFATALVKIEGKIDFSELARLIAAGQPQRAIEQLSATLLANGWKSLASELTQATLAAGTAASAAPALNRLDHVFGVTNPRTLDHLRRYEFNLIRELTADSRASVRIAIDEGVRAGRNPRDVARDVRGHIGLTERQSRAVMNYKRALETGDSAALQRALRDRRFDRSVAAHIRGDRQLSQEQIDRMVERYRERYLIYRSETIARTEAIRAVNTGNQEAWRQAVEDGTVGADQVVRQWVYTHDDRTREEHRAIPGMNEGGVGLEERFDSPLGPILYPGDPDAAPGNTVNCRCTVIIRYQPRSDG